MPPAPSQDVILDLVQEGWLHLRLQRPIAAWASWQRALRLAPDDPRPTEALEVLAQADDLPAAARAAYRFRGPKSETQRSGWNRIFQGRDLQNLDVAAATFAELAETDPADSAARYNFALCLAWQGANAEAIGALERVVALDAAASPDEAADAWTLAEILRAGAGAEQVADDLNHTLTLHWPSPNSDPTELALPGMIRRLPGPTREPSGDASEPVVQLYEWLDRPMPDAEAVQTSADLPRVLASVVQNNDMLRISSPDARALRHVEAILRESPGAAPRRLTRTSTPLALRLLDAGVWNFRFPAHLPDERRRELAREAIEHRFEDDWIHVPRHALGDSDDNAIASRSPADAARAVAHGDPVVHAKLRAVVRIREQLAQRPHFAPLYDGYPFDRLRRRLGLEPGDPATVDSGDVSCMSLAELRALDANGLAEPVLVEAYRSAVALAPDDPVAARFAEELVRRSPEALATIDPPTLAGTLVRAAWIHGDLAGARQWLEQAVAADTSECEGRYRPHLEALQDDLDTYAADANAAVSLLKDYWGGQDQAAEGAVHAAEALLRAGCIPHARQLAAWAETRALEANDRTLADRARACRTYERHEAQP